MHGEKRQTTLTRLSLSVDREQRQFVALVPREIKICGWGWMGKKIFVARCGSGKKNLWFGVAREKNFCGSVWLGKNIVGQNKKVGT